MRALEDWVRKHSVRVDPALWSTANLQGRDTYRVTIGGALVTMRVPELYDLKPETQRQ